MVRFDLTDAGWAVITPQLLEDVFGKERVDARRVPNGIFWRLCTGARGNAAIFTEVESTIASVSSVPHRHGLSPSLLSAAKPGMKSELRPGSAYFRSTHAAGAPKTTSMLPGPPGGTIEVELIGGHRLRVGQAALDHSACQSCY